MPTEPDELAVAAGGGASQTTDPAAGSSAATDVSLREFVRANSDANLRLVLRLIDERDRFYVSQHDHFKDLLHERDLRYQAVDIERDKANVLARANQDYRDEKANELREQIAQERVLYASKAEVEKVEEKMEALLKPVLDFVSSQQGSRQGAFDQRALVSWGVALIATLIGIYFALN